jgi:transposase
MENSSGFRQRFLLRRNVVAAVLSGGHPDAVAKEFGVSRASVYNWVREHNESGVKKLTHADGDKRFAMPGLTPFRTLNFIRHVVVRHPDMSADHLSEYLGSMGRDVSPRTLRNIFCKLGISSANARRSKAFEWQHGQLVDQEISDDELKEILSGLDDLPPGELKGHRPGEVLVQDRVKFPKGYCDEALVLELIVDTFAPMTRVYASLAPAGDQLSVDALSKVQACYTDQGFKIHKICTPRRQQYAGDLGAFAYPKWFDEHLELVLEVRPANSKSADSRIKAAWSLLRSGWLKSMPTRLALGDRHRKQIDGDLQVWLAAPQKPMARRTS